MDYLKYSPALGHWVIDVKKYKQFRWRQKIRFGLVKILTLWSILAVTSLATLPAIYA